MITASGISAMPGFEEFWDPDTCCPRPGRHSVPYELARKLLVDDFSSNPSAFSTREALWTNLEKFLRDLEDVGVRYLNEDAVVDRIWMGGSFVSSKPEPANIDLTVFIHEGVTQAVKGKPYTAILGSLSRRQLLDRYSVNALFVDLSRQARVFRFDSISAEGQQYFLRRGVWDDWWQRMRINGSVAPSVESSGPVRGYLEVAL